MSEEKEMDVRRAPITTMRSSASTSADCIIQSSQVEVLRYSVRML